MKRNADLAETLPDPIRLAAGLPIGVEGAYYVGGHGHNFGQDDDISVIDGNEPPGVPLFPKGPEGQAFMAGFNTRWQQHENDKAIAIECGAQPGLWCQWIPNDDGTAIVWDEGEKFYDYTDWIKYLVGHFLKPWGYSLTGEVYWEGEESDDRGVIRINDNVIEIGYAVITYDFSNKS